MSFLFFIELLNPFNNMLRANTTQVMPSGHRYDRITGKEKQRVSQVIVTDNRKMPLGVEVSRELERKH